MTNEKIDIIGKNDNENHYPFNLLQSDTFQVLTMQEMDRQRIARDLHDCSIQNLVHVIHKIDLASQYIEIDPIRSKLELQTTSNYIRTIINDMRELVFDLRPMIFDDLGFEATLNRYLELFTDSSSIKASLISDCSFHDFSSVFLLSVYRIIQEACNNTKKHSNAKEIIIHFLRKSDYLFLTIEDDGCGCSKKILDKDKHFGIEIIKERVLLLSGKCEFICSEGVGFKINIELPINTVEGET